MPIAGNHDGFARRDWFNNMFCLDTSESVQTNNGVNYSFDYGNAHFAVVNTNDLLSVSLSQLKWLKNDLNSTDKDWKIICMHKSPIHPRQGRQVARCALSAAVTHKGCR